MNTYLSRPGVVCCAGADAGACFDTVIRGDTRGIAETRLTDGRVFPAGLVPVRFPRLRNLARAALEQIAGDTARALARYGPARVGVCVGSCDNGSEESLSAHAAYFTHGAFPPEYALCAQGPAHIAQWVAGCFGIEGPCLTVSTACASSAGAVLRARELLEAGLCDAVLAGGADIVSPTVLLGFSTLENLSTRITNPFSKNRAGITLGEAAAFFVLSREAPGSGPVVALLGAGESADAFHITAPRPDGSGAASAMRRALADAGCGPERVGYINAHGTGTVLNDRMEALAIAEVFSGCPPALSSTKPVTGHTLGAAGALELAICWMTLAEARGLPVHRWDGVPDPDIPGLVFAAPDTAPRDPLVCMSNSFAFGGCNVSIILSHPQPPAVSARPQPPAVSAGPPVV